VKRWEERLKGEVEVARRRLKWVVAGSCIRLLWIEEEVVLAEGLELGVELFLEVEMETRSMLRRRGDRSRGSSWTGLTRSWLFQSSWFECVLLLLIEMTMEVLGSMLES